MSRPRAVADLADQLRTWVPERVAKRLQDGMAEAWTWEDPVGGPDGAPVRRIRTDGEAVVTITGPEPIGPAQLACTCLLSPKCLHVLAVGVALPAEAPADEAPVEEAEVGPPGPLGAEGLLDAVRAVVPSRVQKKLDAGNPAEGWTWAEGPAGWTVATGEGDTVTIGTSGEVGVEHLGCTCLLAPKCFHVLAVAAVIAASTEAWAAGGASAAAGTGASAPGADPTGGAGPATADPSAGAGPAGAGAAGGAGAVGVDRSAGAGAGPAGAGAAGAGRAGPGRAGGGAGPARAGAGAAGRVAGPGRAGKTPEPDLPPDPPVTLDRGQKAVVAAMGRAADAVLLAGANGVGSTALADLERAAHGAAAVGLHRLSKAGTRVRRQILDLQKGRPQFALDELVDDLCELLLVARVLGGEAPTASFVGTGRRTYEPVGTLRLFGLFSEPVAATSGYAGVGTVLCDATGRLWSVSDVRPGRKPGRELQALPASIGGLTLDHERLGRAGLFAQDATASSDGRLGTGGGIKAVRSGPSSWSDPGPAKLFAADLPTQLDRVYAGRSEWLFLEGQVIGAHDDALLLHVGSVGFPIRLVVATDHAAFRFRDNLRLLARAPGLPLRVIGKLAPGRRGSVAAVAVGPWKLPVDPADLVDRAGGDDEGDEAEVELPALALPPEWADRCNLGFDVLVAAHVNGIGPALVEVEPPEVELADPLEAMRRRIGRLAVGGRGTLPGEVRAAIEREAAALTERMMPHAGRALAGLADASAMARTEGGERLTRAWLAAAVYDQAARRSIERSRWR